MTEEKTATRQRTEYLKCILTEEEVAAAAQSLARELDDLTALEANLTKVKAEFKAKMEAANAAVTIQQRLVRDKSEYRSVECDVAYNYTTGTMKVTRKDIDEVVEERKMTYDEKQMKMEFDGEEDKCDTPA